MTEAAELRGRLVSVRWGDGDEAQVRVIGLDAGQLVLTQPYRDGRLVVFPSGSTVTVSVPAAGGTFAATATVSEQRLRPVPAVLVSLPPGLAEALGQQPQASARVVAVTSGKGGVGKTTLTVNISLALAELGWRVVIVDADLGAANADLMLGLHPQGTWSDVLDGTRTVDEIAATGPGGVRLLAGASGIADVANMNEWQFGQLLDALAHMTDSADFVFVDTGAGLSRNVTNFYLAADELLLVTNPEPPAILDAYGVLKTIAAERERPPVHLAMNRAGAREGEAAAARLESTARHFLGFAPSYAGHVRDDRQARAAVNAQQPLLLYDPHSPAAYDVRRLATRLAGGSPAAGGAASERVEQAAGPALPGFLRRLRQLFTES